MVLGALCATAALYRRLLRAAKETPDFGPKRRFGAHGARLRVLWIEESAPMPLAVALLCHPVGTLTALVAAIVLALYAAQSQRFLPTFAAVSAALLTLLAFLQVPPNAAGLAWLLLGVALLHAEFLWPTFGLAGAFGVGT